MEGRGKVVSATINHHEEQGFSKWESGFECLLLLPDPCGLGYELGITAHK